jgi:hypothetical protein
MKKYKYKFTPLVIVLLIALLVIAVCCIGLNVYRLVDNILKNNEINFYSWISYAVIILLSIIAIVLVISIFVKSYYEITEKAVILRWGLIKNEIDLKTVKQIKLSAVNHKLELIFEDESFFVILTNELWFEEFVDEIKQKRPQIVFVQDSVNTDKKA